MKPCQLRNRVWPSFIELSFANFERRPWSHTCSCVALHTCCCPQLSSSPPHTAPRISRVTLERRRRLERRRTPSTLCFLGPLMVCEISARNASIGGVATNHSSRSDPLNCLATHLLRYLVPLSMSTHLAFRSALPVLTPAWSTKHFIKHVHFCRNTPSRAAWLPSVIIPCLIKQILVRFFRRNTVF